MFTKRQPAKLPTKREKAAWTDFYNVSPDRVQPEPVKERAKPVNWEHAEQVHVVYKWDHELSAQYGLPTIALYAVPNAGRRSQALGQYLKAEGLRSGAPDLVLDVARGGFHGLRIEMKRTDGGVQSLEQINFQISLRDQGYRYELCHGADSAIETIRQYLIQPAII